MESSCATLYLITRDEYSSPSLQLTRIALHTGTTLTHRALSGNAMQKPSGLVLKVLTALCRSSITRYLTLTYTHQSLITETQLSVHLVIQVHGTRSSVIPDSFVMLAGTDP